MATISIDQVKKSYGRTQTIHGVSTRVPDGAFVVLVGPSGCGKSTLLRMIAGLEEIDGGTISIDDQVVNDVEPKHRDIAMVFQNYALYPHMTVAANMGFSLRLAGQPRQNIARRVQEAAEILGLESLLERFPKQLSGGQRQRVAMGRAIVRNPRVFLFDEPLSNLDAKLRVQMRAELRALHRKLGTTTVYVTHDQIEAMTMADQIVVMRDGYVEQSGTPLEVYDQPRNRFVAGFIGSPAMNFLPGRLEQSGGQVRFNSRDGQRLTLTGWDHLLGAGDSNDVELGVRPENLHVVGDEATAAIDVLVAFVEPTGAETYLNGTVGDEHVVAVLHERIDAAPGSVIRLGWQAEALRLFDVATGLAIPRQG